MKTSIEYLGYNITPKGITLNSQHVDAILQYPQPRKVVELQRFLGLANYFRRFIQNFAAIAKPLHSLLKKDVNFKFNDECVIAFNKLKELLTSHPILTLYNPNLPTELHTDASSIAIAAILFQKQESGQWTTVAYYSQAINSAEAKYYSFELKMLAIVKAIKRFHIYLYGLNFTIVTDCQALIFAINKAHFNVRIARWTLRLQNYHFSVVYRDGRRMLHVDALSRIAAYIEAMPLEKELQYRQLQDPRVQATASNLETEENKDFQLVDGLVFRKYRDKLLFVVPDSLIQNIIRIYHDNMSHCSIEKTVQGILSNYWFPAVRKHVQAHIENCITCLLANAAPNTREGEMQVTDTPSLPFQTFHVDHFGPLNQSENGFKHVFLVIDAFSRFTWLFPTKSTGSKEIIKILRPLFNTFGNPISIVSDRGTAFTSHEFSSFIKEMKITHHLVAAAAPWANGLVERINRFLKSSLRKIVDDLQTWDTYLDAVQYTINNIYHISLKATPSKLS